MDKNIERSISLLDRWIEKNGWAGYDPYDIKGTKLFLLFQKNKYVNFGSNLFLNRLPMFSRKVFRVKKEINAKAMALFARGYLNLYKKSRDEKYLDNALFCLNWLMSNPSKGYSGFCWGYPFDWQSRVFIPKGMPLSVVTALVGHAFLDYYDIIEDKKFLSLATECSTLFLNYLHVDYTTKDSLCFSYSPVDHFHVLNANLYSAAFLTRLSSYINDKNMLNIARKARNFTISHQNKDGSWYYWASPDKPLGSIDNYHTGIILEWLMICKKYDKEFSNVEVIEGGLDFYIKNLFLDIGIPKFQCNNTYPIDIHSCAQAIVTFSLLKDISSDCNSMYYKVVKWSIENMQKKDGSFRYRIYRNMTDNTLYIRWGQAWMLLALSNALGDV